MKTSLKSLKEEDGDVDDDDDEYSDVRTNLFGQLQAPDE